MPTKYTVDAHQWPLQKTFAKLHHHRCDPTRVGRTEMSMVVAIRTERTWLVSLLALELARPKAYAMAPWLELWRKKAFLKQAELVGLIGLEQKRDRKNALGEWKERKNG